MAEFVASVLIMKTTTIATVVETRFAQVTLLGRLITLRIVRVVVTSCFVVKYVAVIMRVAKTVKTFKLITMETVSGIAITVLTAVELTFIIVTSAVGRLVKSWADTMTRRTHGYVTSVTIEEALAYTHTITNRSRSLERPL